MKKKILKAKYQKLKYLLFKNQKFEILAHSLGGLCHEIRNLITPIILLELMQEEVESKHQEYIQKILHVKNQILSLTENVQSFYNHSSKEKINISKIKKIIDESIIFYELSCNTKKNIQIKTIENLNTHISKPLNIKAKQDQLMQIFINLIKNASDAIKSYKDMPKNNIKKGKIFFKIKNTNKNLTITIADNGGGIRKTHLKDIWKAQFSTKKKKGMGLGLYIVKNIIKSFHGHIDCKNTKYGCQFKIVLPLIT